MSDSRKAVVLLSGGMDSCVCAAIARERHGAGNIALLHAGYGQRTQDRERRAFTEIADFYGVQRAAGRAARSLSRDWRLGADGQEHRGAGK